MLGICVCMCLWRIDGFILFWGGGGGGSLIASTNARLFPSNGKIVYGESLWLTVASVPCAISETVERHHLKIQFYKSINSKHQMLNIKMVNEQKFLVPKQISKLI